MKKIIFLITFLSILFFAPVASAQTYTYHASASLNATDGDPVDLRAVVLKNYFESHNSPLADYAEVFIEYSDEYTLDWRLVPAITGVESTFGKRIPYNSYNAYGWANGKYSFGSWEESIGVVSKALSEKYIARGANTTYEIARIYAPPSSTWAGNVEFFKNKIEPLPLDYAL